MTQFSINVALIGLGSFGKQYAKELLKINKERADLNFQFIICKSLREKADFHGIPIFIADAVDMSIMETIDLFIIVTPAHTHQEIIRSLPSEAFKLVEKPLFDDEQTVMCKIDKSKIRCAQIYRHHPLTKFALNEISPKDILEINSTFTHTKKFISENVLLELNHLIDLSYYIADLIPQKFAYFANISGVQSVAERRENIFIKASAMQDCPRDNRIIEIKLKKGITYQFDYLNHTLLKKDYKAEEKTYLRNNKSLIETEILEILKILENKTEDFCNINLPEQIIKKIFLAKEKRINSTKIAVIGGGIFGSEAARVLAQYGDVTLFEASHRILNGTTRNNQWRHHKGFHYPIAFDTQNEIIQAVNSFEDIYYKAIKNIPSYYVVSSSGREINASRVISSYKLAKLNYEITEVPPYINEDAVSLCVLTDEGIYDIPILRNLCTKNLSESNVTIATDTRVQDIKVIEDYNFEVIHESGGTSQIENFNYVVNTSGDNWSQLANFLSGSKFKVQCELTELLQIKCDLPEVCVSIIDGPFCSLTSKGTRGYFQATQRYQSLKKRSYDQTHKFDGKPLNTAPNLSILANIAKYVRIPTDTQVQASVFECKYFYPQKMSIWDRSTEIINHFNGSVSILGGKILSSTRTANQAAAVLGFDNDC